MTGLDNITARISADAQAEAARIREAAATERAKITAGWEAKADEAYRLAGEEYKIKREADAARAVAAAETDAKKSALAAKQDMVSQAFSLALRRFRELPRADYTAFLAKSAAAGARTGSEELLFNKEDRKAVGKAAVEAANAILRESGRSAALTLSADTRDIAAGVVLRDGSIETNCSVETETALRRGEMAAEVARLMFS